MRQEHVLQVAEIHHRNIKSLLTDLGPRMCRAFYRSALESPRNFGFVDVEDGRVRGFALGTTDNSRLFRAPRLRAQLLLALLRRPFAIRRLLSHFRGFFQPGAEALYEAVDPAFRRQGIATNLYKALHENFRENHVRSYEIRIDADNAANLSLRQKLGARIENEFVENRLRRYRLVVRIDDS
jgi:GNAT superfamily N-acetyltransferase